MSFKKLELYGFKSFADKLSVEFDDGITGIVGPNGCGKSNVADSVRWVLGEQSVKMLRGKTMQDVIFGGTEKRRSLSFCEVSLIFDNKNRTFNMDRDEVVISRKLYRSGESEYSLNRMPARLYEITNLIQDTGIGKEGYCIVGQGRIDAILSAKPDDRRGIFEEAAGISKFKTEKVTAERTLERTKDNIEKVNAVINEIGKQLGPLASQAADARKFLSLSEELKYNEINSYLYQYENAAKTKRLLGEKLDSINEEIELRQSKLQEAESAYNAIMTASNDQDKTVELLHAEQNDLMVTAERIAGHGNVMKERLARYSEENERYKRLIEERNAVIEQYSKVLVDGATKLETLAKELESKKAELSREEEKHQNLNNEIEAHEAEISGSNQKIVTSLDELTNIKANYGRLTAEQDALISRRAENNARIKTLLDDAEKIKQSANEISSVIARLESEKEEVLKKRQISIERANGLTEKMGEVNDEIRALNARVSSLETKCSMLEEMRREYEGYQRSVKSLMRDAETDRELSRHIIGVVAQLITVPEKYQTAVDIALGGSIQDIVVESEEDAKYLINHLKQHGYGRATFQPLSSVKGGVLRSEFRPALGEKGVCGLASEIVSYDRKFAKVIDNLLARTVIVEDMDSAVRVARKYDYGFRIVTLDGESLATSGSISGGSKKQASTNLLSRENEINLHKEKLQEAKNALSKAYSQAEDVKRESNDVQLELTEHNERLRETDVRLATENEKYAKFKGALDENASQVNAIKADNEKTISRIESIETQLHSVDELEGAISRDKQEVTKLIERRKVEFEEKKAERERCAEKVVSLRLEVQAKESETLSLKSENEKAKAICVNAQQDVLNYKSEVQTLMARLKETEGEALSATMSEKDKKRLETIREEIVKITESKKELRDKLFSLDEEKKAYNRQLQESFDKRYKEESALARIDSDIEVMQARIWEAYELTYSGALALKDENFVFEGCVTQINKLRKQINELGNVNVRAIEDYDVLGERHADMTRERDDLEKARDDLQTIIKNLTEKMVTMFETQFAKISANFTKVFKELFDGGTGRLVLNPSESGDPLEAGIDILAEPPGKKLQNISLLSGGERALTAIAILFSIMMLKPMPFCILDEIEAALDDSNAQRFASYLRKFSRQTQFIVITHRKPTMELADRLYGVTMEEKGVSRMVSVKLSDAVKNAEPAVGV